MNAATALATLNVGAVLPELIVLTGVLLVMLYDLFAKSEGAHRAFTLEALALLILVVAGITLAGDFSKPAQAAFGRMFVHDAMGVVLKLAILVAVAFTLIYSRAYLVTRKIYSGEFVMLVLFATLGMMIMVSSYHFVALYMGLEILALSSYTMVALNRDSAVSTEAAMKYFILGALASGLLLYGMSMIYGATGSLDVAKIAKTVEYSRANDPLILFGLIFVVAGLAFKLGAVPFHMWVPDVYHGAPTAMTLFIGGAPKIAAFGFIMRILADSLNGATADWQLMLTILAAGSIALGNIVAIAQTNLKRMLAYSTISHMGFLLLGILACTKNGYASGMFYAISYAMMSIAGFGMILLLSREGFEADNLDDLKGMNQRSPWIAFLILIIMFSMAGIPPFLGFWAKLAVLEGALNAGFLKLVVFAVLMSVIGAYYYLRVVKLMYFDAPTDNTPIAAPGFMRALLAFNVLALLVLGLLPGGLLSVCVSAIQRSL
ncbi:MAG: NADH-quinone oxidoreductase subunit NuoN [Betaproteobacteria bacterium]|nr:NADH-quinone oxidoreductase subunit NuoN [Betaproteobacteria bacterium]